MEIIGVYTKKEYGNDCMIYQNAIISKVHEVYLITITTKVNGWCERIESEVEIFSSESRAKRHLKELNFEKVSANE